MAVQSPIYEGIEDDPVFVMFVVLRKAFSTFDNPPVVNKVWRILKVPMNLAVKCFGKDGVQSLSLDQPKPFMSW